MPKVFAYSLCSKQLECFREKCRNKRLVAIPEYDTNAKASLFFVKLVGRMVCPEIFAFARCFYRSLDDFHKRFIQARLDRPFERALL